MQAKRILTIVLVLALLVGIMVPCKDIVRAADEEPTEVLNLEMVTAPAIGSSYYLGAQVGETMMYFRNGTVTQTAPYSLVVTEDKDKAVQLTAEDPSVAQAESGFQLYYVDGEEKTLRLYCMDVLKDAAMAGQTGVMDTGNNAVAPGADTHNFQVELIDGRAYVTCPGADTVLVVKQLEKTVGGVTTDVWRMLFVPKAEVNDANVYPAMLMQEHDHTLNNGTLTSNAAGHWYVCGEADCGAAAAVMQAHTCGNPEEVGNAIARTCTVCSYTEKVYDQEVSYQADAVIGEAYYLGADVNGSMKYFKTGTVSNTVPYSLVVTGDLDNATLLTAEDPAVTNAESGFQLTYINSKGATIRIYCMDALKDSDTVTGLTGVMDTGNNGDATYEAHNIIVHEGMLLNESTEHVLVVKQVPQNVTNAETGETTTKDVWRMLFVPLDDLEDDTAAEYPVMLLKAHTHEATDTVADITATTHGYACWCGGVSGKTEKHTYGEPTTNGDVVSRECTVCHYVDATYEQLAAVTEPVIGGSYYLGANVNGTMYYFSHSTLENTVPYSLPTRTNFAHNWTVPMVLESPEVLSEEYSKGFQMVYTYAKSDGTEVSNRIYCIDKLKDATVEGQTDVMDTGATASSGTAYKNRHNFFMSEVNGLKLITSTAKTNHVLVAKQVPLTAKDATTGAITVTETLDWRMLFAPAEELNNEGVYPVMLLEEHAHVAGETISGITDTEHGFECWCGGLADPSEHAYGKPTHNHTTKTTTRTCTVCGYVSTVHGYSQAQVKYPTIGETYNLVANVNGELLSLDTPKGGYTGTSPYSIITTTTIGTVTLEAALESGKGEFQLKTADAGKVLYCTGNGSGQGLGATTSSGYVSNPERVSFSMAVVNGQTLIQDYSASTSQPGLYLAVKYSEAKSAYRIFPVTEDEIGAEGVYPVMLTKEHTEHTKDSEWHYNVVAENSQSRLCAACGYPMETLHTQSGTTNKFLHETAPTIGNTYYLAANVAGTLQFFISGTTTNTAPYSLVVTDNHAAAQEITLEDYTAVGADNAGKGFQMTYTTSKLLRIYCYDTLKDADLAGQTGIMDTGNNTANTASNHTFFVDEVDGVKVLCKYDRDLVLVVKKVPGLSSGKLTEAKDWRMLCVAKSELADEGVYPVMLMTPHEHDFGRTLVSNADGHYGICDCETENTLTSHSFHNWDMDRANGVQSASCKVCGYDLKNVESPHYDDVESQEELDNFLATPVLNDEEKIKEEYGDDWTKHKWSLETEGAKGYYLTAMINGERFYFRKAGKTTTGLAESITKTAPYSLYATNDPKDTRIAKVFITPGNTEGVDTYVLTFDAAGLKYIYIGDTGGDSRPDTGNTSFQGVSTDKTYIARSEFKWDEENDRLYQMEGDVKYILVFKEMVATYGNESFTEWRMIAVPESDLEDATEQEYPVTLTHHLHNYKPGYSHDDDYHWLTCYCDYEAKQLHEADWYMDIVPHLDNQGEKMDGHKSGTCDTCDVSLSLDVPYPVIEWGVELGKEIGLRFLLNIAPSDKPVFKLDGEAVELDISRQEDGTYTAFVPMAAAQMTDTLNLFVGDFILEKGGKATTYELNETFSVRTAAQAILGSDSYNQYARDLAKHMLSYGAAAQQFFNYKATDLAGEIQEVTIPAEVNTSLNVTNNLDGIGYYGASLVHDSATSIRFYFTADNMTGITFKLNDKAIASAYDSEKKMHYVEVPGLLGKDLNMDMTVTATKGGKTMTIVYNPVTYMSRMASRQSSGETLKNLTKAMYGYYDASRLYKENMAAANLSRVSLRKQISNSYEVTGYNRYIGKYTSATNDVTAYIVTVDKDAAVELKVSAGAWSDANTAENPAETMIVKDHYNSVKNSGETVLAMFNGGFFDMNTGKTMKPYGMQIVDGNIIQEPKAGVRYADNWFGMTNDGKYVISDAAGYQSTYINKVQQGIGGDKLVIVDGEVQDLGGEATARTAVGINADGDLVMLVANNATYGELAAIFKDVDPTIKTVLNLDGGGSTAFYRIGSTGKVTYVYANSLREVADAVGIIAK